VNNTTTKLLVTAILIFLVVYLYIGSSKNTTNDNIPNPDPSTIVDPNTDENTDPVATSTEMMTLVVYVQDKGAVTGPQASCTVTMPKTYIIPKTMAVADASLKILFTDELKSYGTYDSVTIESGVAKVMLKSNQTASGGLIGSLSSCEGGHLMAVLLDTLTQYPTIQSVELYSPGGKVEF
jgi:hypothetical protein